LSSITLNLLETLNLVAPLGLRFWDEVTQTAIADGLSVDAYPADNPLWRIPAFSNHGTVYAFRDLPGLRKFESGTGDADFWTDNPPSSPFVIEVRDLQRRFHSFSFQVDVPVHQVWEWTCHPSPPPRSSPPEPSPRGVPLFSAPARNAPSGMAVVRATIMEADDPANTPGAWSLLKASIGGKLVGQGLAGEDGQTVMIFAYPDPPEFSPGSPATRQRSLRDQSWELEISAFYVRKDPVSIDSVPRLPNLCQLLNQPLAILWDDAAHTAPFTTRILRYGEELTLRSGSQSALHISVAGSP
jgi:hypothetical protein